MHFNPDNGGSMVLQNIGIQPSCHMVQLIKPCILTPDYIVMLISSIQTSEFITTITNMNINILRELVKSIKILVLTFSESIQTDFTHTQLFHVGRNNLNNFQIY